MNALQTVALFGIGGAILYLLTQSSAQASASLYPSETAPSDTGLITDPYGGSWNLNAILTDLVTPSSGATVIGTDNMTRGERNNNPGNIVYSNSTNWQGQTGSDGKFVVFDIPENGIRALAKLLLNYARRGLTTITSIVNTYAPPSENDTGSYVNAVSASMSIPSSQQLDLFNSPDQLAALTSAIITHENGRNIYDSATMLAGISAATYA